MLSEISLQRLRSFPGDRCPVLGGLLAAVAVGLIQGCASVAPVASTPPPTAKVVAATEPVRQRAVAPAPLATAPVAPPVQAAPVAAATPPAVEQTAGMRESVRPRWTPDSNLWDRIRGGFALPPLDTPLVADRERVLLSRPDLLIQMLQRGAPYLFHIVEELEQRGMPTELALLPFVESAMNPVAESPARAVGLWQFIPSTGRAFDLHQNWWVDNRRDPVKSTQAALDYLQKIHAMHGDDWFLALASYNWGENAVARAVRKNQARGLPGDYLSLEMPRETRQYVPRLIALKNVLLRIGELGLALPHLPNRPYFVTIEKTRPIDLKLAANFAGMSVEEFVALNPAHNRPVIAASRNNEIKLPADRRQAFLDAMERHQRENKPLASWQPYTLKPGDTLDSIARSAGVSSHEIRKANGLREHQRIVAGTRIIAPQQQVEDEMRVESFVAPRVYEHVERPAVYHTVEGKESLISIAQRYGISAATLTAWNGIKQGIRRGMRLLVQPPATQTLLTDENGSRTVVAVAPRTEALRTSVSAKDSVPQASAATGAQAARKAPPRDSGQTADRASDKRRDRRTNGT
jgi:membrane-bound lytic murein transglycosylase D